MSRTLLDEYGKFIEHNWYRCTKHKEYFRSRQEMEKHLREVHLNNGN